MGVPTIVSITPASIPTGGLTLVEIRGTNFRVPVLPAPTFPSVPAPPTVEVLFATVKSIRVAVVSSTRMFVYAPKSPIEPIKANAYGEGVVALTVRNVDDLGVVIPGETVTLTNGITYSRAQLALESDLTRITRQILREFRLQTIPNVSVSTHTDFDPETGDLLNITGLASLPGIALIGPDLEENREYTRNQRTITSATAPGEFVLRRSSYTVNLTFGIVGVSDLKVELTNLMAVVNSYFERNKSIALLRNPSDPSLGSVEYEIDFTEDGDLKTINTSGESNIRAFSGRFVIRGFDMQDLTGFSGDQIIDKTASTDDDGARVSTYQLGQSYKVGPSPKGSGGV